MKLADRMGSIDPFYVMEFAKAAGELAQGPACDPTQGGRPMIYLNIGEPDHTAAPRVREAAMDCLRSGHTQYTQATGLPALRQRIAGWYRVHFGIDIPAERIVVTAGASAALQLVCLALFQPGDEVLMPDPCYPCNRNFVTAAGGSPRLLRTTAEGRFQLEAKSVSAAWSPATRGVVLASPGNPTGTSIAPEAMADIVGVVRAHGGVSIVDEIYLGLSFEQRFGRSALSLGDDVISINSFSKYFGMTGWRLGWVVLPPALVEPVERLAQHLYICPSSVAQRAALACFEPESLAICEARRLEFKRRRDFIVPALESLGLPVPVAPDGAFYAWFDCASYSPSSWDFCFDMMRRAHVALTPGRDFGPAHAERFVRLSFASSMEHLEEAVRRMRLALSEGLLDELAPNRPSFGSPRTPIGA
jgi:aspartate/methionine/tyrosine aminotransferase